MLGAVVGVIAVMPSGLVPESDLADERVVDTTSVQLKSDNVSLRIEHLRCVAAESTVEIAPVAR